MNILKIILRYSIWLREWPGPTRADELFEFAYLLLLPYIVLSF